MIAHCSRPARLQETAKGCTDVGGSGRRCLWLYKTTLVVAIGSTLANNVNGQTVPGAGLPGRLERDTQREPQPARRDGAVSIDRARFPEQVPPGAAQLRLTLREVVLSGNAAVQTAELAPLWQDQIGREMSLADGFAIAARISAAYRERGFVLSQAVVPQQDLDVAGAKLRIQVLEGFIDKRTVTGAPGSSLAAYLAPIGAERPATLATLERQLLLVNELPGVQARANLQAGSVPNASDLELVVQRTPWSGSLALHNRIAPSQGDVRIDADATRNGLFGDFDRHNLRLSSSGDKRLMQLSYGVEVPLGSAGWKAQAGLSTSKSEPEVAVISLDTRSSNVYAGLSYPVLRSRQTNLGVRAQLAGYNNSSDTLGLRTSEDRIRALRLGFSADHTDPLGGVNLLDVEFSQGLSGLGASEADGPSLNGAKPDFSRASIYAARLQNLGGAFSLLLAGSSQTSGDKLPTAEQLGLGGETFLRGYDPSEAIGEQGWAVKLELRFNADVPMASTTWYAFADTGSVTRQQGGGAELKTSLSSAGAGVRFTGPAGVRGYLEVAKPLGDKVASKDSSSARVFAGFGIDF